MINLANFGMLFQKLNNLLDALYSGGKKMDRGIVMGKHRRC